MKKLEKNRRNRENNRKMHLMAKNRCKNKNNPYFMAIDQEFIL